MERAAGVNLTGFLTRHRLDPATRVDVARTMADALGVYVNVLGEALPDFNFGNVLYDWTEGTLTFVDLGEPQDAVPGRLGLGLGLSDYELSVGDLLGSIVFQSARPRYLLRRRQHVESVALAVAVVGALQAAGRGPLRSAELMRAAGEAYRRCAFGRSISRSAWYATFGYLVGRRISLGERTFGPLAPWRLRR